MRVSVISPRLSVDRNAVARILKPIAFSHSPRRTSIGTLTVARPTVTFDAKTRWIGSAYWGRGRRLCALRARRAAREAVRDFLATGGSFAKSPFQRWVTDRAGWRTGSSNRRARGSLRDPP